MMSLAILFAAASPQPAPPAEVQREIVVIGKRLATWKATIRSKDGRIQCVTTASSGDQAIDDIGCGAMSTCVPQFGPRIIASADKRRSPAERKALAAATNTEIAACLTAERGKLIGELADRRYEARLGSNNAAD